MNELGYLLRSSRPRQWTKNLVVFGAVIFSGSLTDPALLLKSLIAFVSLCALSSATYIANDIRDRETDRVHPGKRHRPIAAGDLDEKTAAVGAVVLLAVAAGSGVLAGGAFLVGAGLYLVVQLAYGAFLKDVVVLDIMAIATGFVIRAVAGAWAIGVPISPWLVICAGLLALFLAAAKRRHELVLLGEDSNEHRPVLEDYSPVLLDQILSTLSAATIVTYSLYTFFAKGEYGSGEMVLTIPFVVYGVLRYQYLVHRRNEGGSPEEILLGDRPILATVVLWMIAALGVLYYTN